jgi:amino acid adenylation domain-containing protein
MEIQDFIAQLKDNNFFLTLKGGDKLILKADRNKATEEQIRAIKRNKEVVEFIKSNKEDLIEYLSSEKKKSRDDVTAIYKLSPLQAGMMFHDLYDEKVGAYRNQLQCDLTGLDVNIFKQVWSYLMANHSILRSSFHHDAFKIPVQSVHAHCEMPIVYHDLQSLSGEALDQEISRLEQEDRQQGFDFAKAPLMRVMLLQTEANKHRMVWTSHHILLDGWSRPILMEEFLTTYDVLADGKVPVPREEDRFEDYISYIERQDKAEDEAFWANYLISINKSTLLPFVTNTDSRTRTVSDFKRKIVNLSPEVKADIEDFARTSRVTVNTVMQGIWSYLLHQYTGQEEVCFGVVVSGRPEDLDGVEEKVGMYINTLPLVSSANAQTEISTWLQGIQKDQVAARKHQYNSIADIQRVSGVKGDLFDSIMVFQNFPISELVSQREWKLGVDNFRGLEQSSNYPLLIRFSIEDGIQVEIIYKEEMLASEFIEVISAHLEEVIQQFTSIGKTHFANISLAADAGPRSVISEFGRGEAAPIVQTVVELFTNQTEKTPDHIALRYEGKSFTYQELDQRSNQLARYLKKRNPGPVVVPLLLEKSPEMIISMLGILKAGSAYLPLGKNDPQLRIEKILKEVDSPFLVCQQSTIREKLPVEALVFEDLVKELEQFEDSELESVPAREQLAYMIFTSGSTGEPKGVKVGHASFSNYLLNQRETFGITEAEKVLQFSDYTFDASVEQIFLALTTGATLVLLPDHYRLDKDLFEGFLTSEKITHLHATPSFLKTLTPGRYGGLKRIVSGGELCELSLAENWKHFCDFYNKYGPAEATISVCQHQFDPGSDYQGNWSVPIGKTIRNTQLYVLNESQEPVGLCVPGELYIGGDQLSLGYWNDEALNQAYFITSPFDANERLYRTGDLVRWMPDGNLEYMGRKDEQVKVRGFRIELGEVESALLEAPGVQECVVIVSEKSNHAQLVAYVVVERVFDQRAILEYLGNRIPEYMIPSLFLELDEIPLLPSGKVDKQQLGTLGVAETQEVTYEKPNPGFEEDMATVWAQLLTLDQVGRLDNYFELGGDSIVSIQVVSRMRKMGHDLQVGDLFTYQTIARINTAFHDRLNKRKSLDGLANSYPVTYYQKDLLQTRQFQQGYFVSIAVPKEASVPDLEAKLNVLLAQNESLRASFELKNDNWEATFSKKKASLLSQQVADKQALKDLGESAIAALELDQLFQFTHAIVERESANYLVLAFSSLIADRTSIEVLMGELKHLLESTSSAATGTATEFKSVLSQLDKFSEPETHKKQLSYWQQALEKVPANPVRETKRGAERCTQQFGITGLQDLLAKLGQDDHKSIETLILSALASQKPGQVIGLISDSRKDLETVSPSVGPYTSLFPFVLPTSDGLGSEALVRATKEQFQQVPDTGLAYGAAEPKLQLAATIPWSIRLQCESQSAKASINFLQSLRSGEKASLHVGVDADQLTQSWAYDPELYSKTEIENLSDEIKAFIAALAYDQENWVRGANELKVPSDYGLSKEVTLQELEDFKQVSLPNGVKVGESITACYRLSSLQSGMLFHSLYDEDAATYRNQLKCDIRNVDEQAFRKTWDYLIRKHTIFRSSFHHDAFSIPVQCVHAEVKAPIEIIDLRGTGSKELATKMAQIEHEDINRGFPFESAPLMRVILIHLDDIRSRMLWTSHHLLHDGWSLPILMEEFLQAYEQAIKKQEVTIKEDKYEDYIRFIEQQDRTHENVYWQQYLDGLQGGTLFPFIEAAPERNKGVGEYLEENLNIGTSMTNELRAFASRQRITLNTVMQGAWAYLLSQYSGQSDVSFGVVVSGRPEALSDLEGRVGMYINTLPLRAEFTGQQEVSKWLQGIQSDQVNSRNNQYISLNEIQTLTGIQGDLFDSIMAFQNFPISKIVDSQDWELKVDDLYVQEQSNFPIYITIGAFEEINAHFFYNTSLISERMIKQITGHYYQILKGLLDAETTRLKDLSMVVGSERNELLFDFNDNKVARPADQTLIELFRSQVAATPDQTCLVGADSVITYQQVEDQSNAFASYLLVNKTAKGQLIPMLFERKSADVVIAMLGIQKAGHAFVPIDPAFPEERISYLLNDLKATYIVTDPSLAHLASEHGKEAVLLGETDQYAGQVLDTSHGPESLAYVIYTSGSTGNPKGVMVAHKSLSNYLMNSKELYADSSQASGSFNFLSYTFDAAITALFVPLINGQQISFAEGLDVGSFSTSQFADHAPYDFIKLTPAHFHLLENGQLTELPTNKFVTGGEALRHHHVKFLNQQTQPVTVFNEYGPTEATVGCCVYRFNSEDGLAAGDIPIGKPMPNVSLYVLNDQLKPVPVGAVGELFVGGVQVANGYLGQEALTQVKFLPNPFEAGTMYRTGDKVRILEDGNLIFVGRKDHQVKVNGYRIELDEIETVINASDLVRQVAVVIHESGTGMRHIIAHLVPNAAYSEHQLTLDLKKKLPSYMIPSSFHVMEELPLTVNGKVDRKALASMQAGMAREMEYEAPTSDLESALVTIWQEVLKLDQVGIGDDFFKIGGNSLLAISVISLIRKRLDVEVTVSVFFELTTIAGLAKHIHHVLGQQTAIDEEDYDEIKL